MREDRPTPANNGPLTWARRRATDGDRRGRADGREAARSGRHRWRRPAVRVRSRPPPPRRSAMPRRQSSRGRWLVPYRGTRAVHVGARTPRGAGRWSLAITGPAAKQAFDSGRGHLSEGHGLGDRASFIGGKLMARCGVRACTVFMQLASEGLWPMSVSERRTLTLFKLLCRKLS